MYDTEFIDDTISRPKQPTSNVTDISEEEEEVLDKTVHGKENSPDITGKSLFKKLHLSFLKSRVV